MPFRNFIEELTAGSVTAEKIAVGAVGTTAIADDAITAAKILDGSITGVLIEDGAVTATKLAATAIDAKTITAAVWQTVDAGRRLVIEPGGFDGASPGELNWYASEEIGATPGSILHDVDGASPSTSRHTLVV